MSSWMLLIAPALAWEHTGKLWHDRVARIELAEGEGRPEGWVEAWEAAVETWNAVECSGVVLEITSTTAENERSPQDDLNRMVFGDPDDEIEPAYPAITYSLSSNTPVHRNGETYRGLADVDVVFNDGFSFLPDSALGADCTDAYSLQGIATKELGYLLGLAQSCVLEEGCTDAEREATMYGEFFPCDATLSTLGADDIEGIRALYGPWIDVSCGTAPLVGAAPYDVACTGVSYRAGDPVLGWDFGDGGTAEGADAAHTYEAPGAYVVRVCGDVETDTCSDLALCTEREVLVCGEPAPAFEVVSIEGLTVRLANTAVPDAAAPEAACVDDWMWRAFDAAGEPVSSSPAADTFTVTFTEAGTHLVTLTATGLGGEATFEMEVTVEGGPDAGGPAEGCGCGGGVGPAGAATLVAMGIAARRRRRTTR